MNKIIYQKHIIIKKFGQHFLHDKNIIKNIIYCINPKPNQSMVEIGPGLGALTKPISNITNNMQIIEIDHNLANKLINEFLLNKKIKIIKKDVLKVNFIDLYNKYGKLIRIFGNLPYNCSTQIIFHVLKYIHIIKDMHFMIQKELANRIIANPNCKEYGKLSILIQYFCKINLILKVTPISFFPIPKVHSAVIKLIPRSNISIPVHNLNKFTFLLKIAFEKRRKMLRNSLSNLFSIKELENQGIDTKLRAENLTIDQYCKLANILSNRIN